MKLKEREEENFFKYFKKFGTSLYKALVHKRSKIFFLIIFAIVFFAIGTFAGLMFTKYFGTFENPSQKALKILPLNTAYGLRELKTKIKYIQHENIKIPFNYLQGQFSNPDKIFIDINFENLQQIEFKRQQAIEKGYLDASGEDYVSATISYGKDKFKADIRLKGDESDHWIGNKWSFRVELKGEETLNGMKVFSIQKPSTRNYLTEFLYHIALKEEKIIGLRYNFIEVILNGEKKGIYAIEEHFDKLLIENNNRSEGVIIRFSEDFTREKRENLRENYWDDEDYLKICFEKNIEWFYSSKIDVYGEKKVYSNPQLNMQFEQAKNVLEAFRRQDLQTREAFDIDKLATYFALNTLFGSPHASDWTNIKFYFNPLTSKLEPIGFDSNGGPGAALALEEYLPNCIILSKGDDCSKKPGNLEDLIFRDPVLLEKYLNELKRVSEKEYLDELFKKQETNMKNFENIIHKDEPIYYFSKDIFYANQEIIKNKLETVDDIKITFVKSENNKIIVQAEGTGDLPVKILNLNCQGIIFDKISGNLILQPKNFGINQIETFEFSIPKNFQWKDDFANETNVTYSLLGSSKIKQKELYKIPYLKEEFQEEDFIRQESNLSEFEFLEIDENNKFISIKKGAWTLEKNLILPKEYKIFCYEGTTIDLVKNSTILSYSPIYFYGKENNPIKITSSDKTGQGLTLLNANKISNLNSVVFNNLTNPSKSGWNLTGAITFYYSPFIMNYVTIQGMGCEDSLHVVNSHYEIKNSIFENCFSDCFDDDFGKGIIESSSFTNCGGDCIDVSGSDTKLNNLNLFNSGDKGISVGERSNITAQNININRGFIGIASKDLSDVTIKNLTVTNASYSIAIYQKKPEFGHSSMVVENLQLSNVKNTYVLEKNSYLFLEGTIILSQEEKVYDKLYGSKI